MSFTYKCKLYADWKDGDKNQYKRVITATKAIQIYWIALAIKVTYKLLIFIVFHGVSILKEMLNRGPLSMASV